MSRQEVKIFMEDSLSQIYDILSYYNVAYKSTKAYVYCYIQGVKVEWNIKCSVMRLGYGNSQKDLHQLEKYFSSILIKEELKVTKRWIDIFPPSVEGFDLLISSILESDFILESPVHIKIGNQKQSGVSFEGTNFSNAHERMTTIGPRFMSMVCKASGMKLENIDSEWVISDGGRIDGVELNDKGEVVSIYECQSGIQNGEFLDTEHLCKALLRYPFDKKVIKTLEKIVILAGGYSDECLNIISCQSEMFIRRECPIEVVLLKTEVLENKVQIVKHEFI